MDSFFILEIIGTVAFAISGAIVAMKCGMDVFGVTIIGLTTACGGGAVRDLILGITPPTVFVSPLYAFISIGVSIIFFLPFMQNILGKNKKLYDVILIIADSLGLGTFSVIGVKTALNISASYNLFLLVFVGVVTGVGGGVLRDIMTGNKPQIFIRHFYACASIIGTFACAILWNYIGETFSMITGTVIIVILRLLAAKFRWKLPKSKLLFDGEEE